MSIRTFGRTLGLGAVVLSAVLLIVALVGGMTTGNARPGPVQAVATRAEHPPVAVQSGAVSRDPYSTDAPAGLSGAR